MHLSILHRLLGSGTVALAEGEVIERIRRQDAGLHDPHLLNAPLVYNAAARCALVKLYRQYLDIGRRFDIPQLACIDTRCASKSRLERAGLVGREVNADSVRFMKEIIEAYGAYAGKVCLVRLRAAKEMHTNQPKHVLIGLLLRTPHIRLIGRRQPVWISCFPQRGPRFRKLRGWPSPCRGQGFPRPSVLCSIVRGGSWTEHHSIRPSLLSTTLFHQRRHSIWQTVVIRSIMYQA